MSLWRNGCVATGQLWWWMFLLLTLIVAILSSSTQAFVVTAPSQRQTRKRNKRNKKQSYPDMTASSSSSSSFSMLHLLMPSQLITSTTRSASTFDKNNKSRQTSSSSFDEDDSTTTLLRMIPSQVVHARAPRTRQDETRETGNKAPTATLDKKSDSNNNNNNNNENAILQQNQVTTPSRRSRRRLRPKKKKRAPSPNTNTNGDQNFPTTGHLPDPWYRAISMNHVRRHPRFRPLMSNDKDNNGHPQRQLNTLDDVQYCFPQESWQWQELHSGRCTTSQAAGALGFLNQQAAQVLGVPVAWRKGGRGAYHRLSEPALRTLAQMQERLVTSDHAKAQDRQRDDSSSDEDDEDIWGEPVLNNDNDNKEDSKPLFLAEYLYQPNLDEYRRRRKYIKDCSGGEYLDRGIRMIWGNTQEATSLITALNYFHRHVDAGVVLEECGMCGAGLEFNTTASNDCGLLLGATPDGILRYSDGRIEALEVKNHCPFFSNKNRHRRAGRVKRFSIGDRLVTDGGVLPQYVSQLQLEMLCLGPECESAVMVRQTATCGATVWRMRRNEAWIEEMIHFLTRFQEEFVNQQISPPADFFWDNMPKGSGTAMTLDEVDQDALREQSRYRRFVNKTAELCNSVELVAVIPNEEIQRVQGEAPFFLDAM